MKLKFNYFFIIFISYLIFGFFVSLKTGISHDESHEQYNWLFNLEALKSIFGLGDYNLLKSYTDKYYGIGFQLFSQPIQFLLSSLIINTNQVTFEGFYLLTKHPVIFIFFSISGLAFYSLCKEISLSKTFSRLSLSIYLLYPYLFGHSLMNPKDIPFLSFWLISTYYLIKLLKKIYFNQIINLKNIFIASLLFALTISIRIVGLMLFIQVFIGLLIIANYKQLKIFELLKSNFTNIFNFIIFFILILYLINPIYWKNPFEIINSIKFMSKFYHDVCTLTLGECMRSLDLPIKYYFIWIFFKLPIICLIGITVYPFVEKKLQKNNFSIVTYMTILISTVTILLLLILKKVALYDEIRQIAFLLPGVIMISLYNIYFFKKKIFYAVSCLTILFFLVVNIKLFPYQYTWLNLFAKTYEINKTFELDYWGLSNKNLQKQVIIFAENNKIKESEVCVYGDAYVEVFLKPKGFNCFGFYSEIDSVKQRPFFAYQNLRNLKKNNPTNCSLIHEESYSYPLFREKINVGKVWWCY